MSSREDDLLSAIGIPKSTIALALGVSRQAVVKGMADKERDYLTTTRLVMISAFFANENPRLDQVFRDEALRRLGPAAVRAFGKAAVELRVDAIELRAQGREPTPGDLRIDSNPTFRGAREMWTFASRPRELESPGYLPLMTDAWFRKSREANVSEHLKLAYFTSPDVGRTLGRMLLRIFETIPKPYRNPVYLFESTALTICPRFVIVNPLPDVAEGWVFGQEEHQLFKMAPSNTRHIIETLRRAGIVGFTEFMAEDFNSERGTSRDFPDFCLRFVSTDLERSKVLLGDRTFEVVKQQPSSGRKR